jgi:hypothetical protein
VFNKAALTRHGFGETPHRGDLSLDKERFSRAEPPS